MNHLSNYYLKLFTLYNTFYVLTIKITPTSFARLDKYQMIINVLFKVNCLLVLFASLYSWIYQIEKIVYNFYTISYITLFMFIILLIICMFIKSHYYLNRWLNNRTRNCTSYKQDIQVV